MPPFLFGWLLAAVLGAASLRYLFSRRGYPSRVTLGAFFVLSSALFIGSKVAFLFEAWMEDGLRSEPLYSLILSPEFRVPGGMLLAVAIGPFLARILHVEYLEFADNTVPSAASCLVGIRIGCFWQGCCFGRPTDLPWGVTYPPYTEVFGWQLNHGLVDVTDMASQPVHPLQLYFIAAAVLMGLGLWKRLSQKRFSGEVLLLFLVMYCSSTWLLEFLRAKLHHLITMVMFVVAMSSSILLILCQMYVRATCDPIGHRRHQASRLN